MVVVIEGTFVLLICTVSEELQTVEVLRMAFLELSRMMSIKAIVHKYSPYICNILKCKELSEDMHGRT